MDEEASNVSRILHTKATESPVRIREGLVDVYLLIGKNIAKSPAFSHFLQDRPRPTIPSLEPVSDLLG